MPVEKIVPDSGTANSKSNKSEEMALNYNERTQRLESLGTMTSELAHDFNNLLTVIASNADFIMSQLPADHEANENIDQIQAAVDQASELTSQVLRYCCKTQVAPEPVDLSKTLDEVAIIFDSVITKKAVFEKHLTEDLPLIEARSSQVKLIVMNLITNASEAIGNNIGLIKLSTGNLFVTKDELDKLHFGEDLSEGQYVFLEVSDTGDGINSEDLEMILKPFFTTKVSGHGIGLAAVAKAIQQSHGGLGVWSEPGKGTIFRVLFPATNLKPKSINLNIQQQLDFKGVGTVLVVDDKKMIRVVASGLLRKAGYMVITANDGFEALQVLETHADDIKLVLLDLTMPRMDGTETAEQIRSMWPNIPILFSSGYCEVCLQSTSGQHHNSAFIHKPYKYNQLMTSIRQLLDDCSQYKDDVTVQEE